VESPLIGLRSLDNDGMPSLSEYGQTARAVHNIGLQPVRSPEYRRPALGGRFPRLRSRLPTLWSKSYLVASAGRLSAAAIRRYVAKQTTRPEKGKP
jgi:REP element-mobilizing transposase RayT